MNFTSCPSSTFVNSHRLTVLPNIGGSLAFLHSSRPFAGYIGTKNVILDSILEGYQPIKEITLPEEQHLQEIWQNGKRIDSRDTLLFGRLHLPHSKLEAIFARRLSSTRQLILTALSSSTLPNKGTIFAQLQQDHGTHTNEWIYNTDDALLGFRHMRHLGGNTVPNEPTEDQSADELPFPPLPADLPLSAYGRFSAGFEVYYGALHKSGGMSCGMRFATLPSYHGHPTTMTITVNPLVGHLSSTYTLKATGLTTLCSRLDFNIFSYESDLTLGGEVWHYPSIRSPSRESDETRLGFEESHDIRPMQTGPSGVLKAYIHSASLEGGVLWEGRVKDFLVSFGGKFNLVDRDFRKVGVEIQYGA